MVFDRQKVLKFYEKYMLLIGCIGHLMFVVQGASILINKNAQGVSFPGFFIAFTSLISWFLYGLLKSDNILVIVNLFGILASGFCLISMLAMS